MDDHRADNDRDNIQQPAIKRQHGYVSGHIIKMTLLPSKNTKHTVTTISM